MKLKKRFHVDYSPLRGVLRRERALVEQCGIVPRRKRFRFWAGV